MSSQPSLKSTHFFRSIGLVGFMTAMSRVLGLIREIIIANILGTSAVSDAFTIAFMVPNLFRRLFSEGILGNLFIPIYKEIGKTENNQKALQFAASFFWFLFLFFLLFCGLFIVYTPEILRFSLAAGLTEPALSVATILTRIMVAYVCFISLAAVLQGILNAHSVFWVSSFTPILLNLTIIGFAIFLIPFFESPAITLSVAVLTGGALQLLFQMPFTIKKGFRIFSHLSLLDDNLKKTICLIVPSIFGMGVYHVNILISTSMASFLYEGSVSSLKFSNRLIELIIGVLVVSTTTVALPRMADLFLENKNTTIQKSLDVSLHLILFITIPIIFGTLALNEEIVSLIFGRGKFDQESVALTCTALKYHISGLFFIAWNRALLTVYQASKEIKATVQAGLLVIIVNMGLAFGLSKYMGHSGIALAASLSQLVHTFALCHSLKKMALKISILSFLKHKSFWLSLLSSVLMYLLVINLKSMQNLFPFPKAAQVVFLVAIGGCFYLTLSYLFGSKELIFFTDRIKENIPLLNQNATLAKKAKSTTDEHRQYNKEHKH